MKLNECEGYEDWMVGNITEVPFTCYNTLLEITLYIAWDETGEDIIKASTSSQEVIAALKGYAESL